MVCRVCDVCWPSAGRTPADDCGELRTDPAYYPYLSSYVDFHCVVFTIEHTSVMAARPSNLDSVAGSVERFFYSL